MATNTTRTPDDLDPDSLDVLEFTAPARTTRKAVTTDVDLVGHTYTFRRPKDGILFFTQAAVADSANDADRWMASLSFLQASLQPQDRKHLLDRACDPDDALTAGAWWEVIGELLRRWAPDSKVPASEPVTIDAHPDTVTGADPVRILDEDLRLDLVAHPPKDVVLGLTGSAIAAGANTGQQAWCINLFLDAALSSADALDLDRRLSLPPDADPLDLGDLFGIVEALIGRWYGDTGNRAARRAKASTARKKAPAKKSASNARRAPAARQRTIAGRFEDED